MVNKKAWAFLFKDLYEKNFVPQVHRYLHSKILNFKVLLIIDNHPAINHKKFKVIFHPPNTTSLLKPLDQRIIATFNSCYSFNYILEKIENNEKLNVISAAFDLRNCIN